jgi:hypothetical protein
MKRNRRGAGYTPADAVKPVEELAVGDYIVLLRFDQEAVRPALQQPEKVISVTNYMFATSKGKFVWRLEKADGDPRNDNYIIVKEAQE